MSRPHVLCPLRMRNSRYFCQCLWVMDAWMRGYGACGIREGLRRMETYPAGAASFFFLSTWLERTKALLYAIVTYVWKIRGSSLFQRTTLSALLGLTSSRNELTQQGRSDFRVYFQANWQNKKVMYNRRLSCDSMEMINYIKHIKGRQTASYHKNIYIEHDKCK